jgi:hypothetical protein
VAERRLEQVLTSWGRLYGLLRDTLRPDTYHHGKSLERVEESGDKVAAHFADGTRVDADLVVGADGLFSTLRRQFLPEVRPQFAGYVASRGIMCEIEVSAETRHIVRLVFLQPAAGRADSGLSDRGRKRSLWARATTFQYRLVPARRRGWRIAELADRYTRCAARAFDSAGRHPSRGDGADARRCGEPGIWALLASPAHDGCGTRTRRTTSRPACRYGRDDWDCSMTIGFCGTSSCSAKAEHPRLAFVPRAKAWIFGLRRR